MEMRDRNGGEVAIGAKITSSAVTANGLNTSGLNEFFDETIEYALLFLQFDLDDSSTNLPFASVLINKWEYQPGQIMTITGIRCIDMRYKSKNAAIVFETDLDNSSLTIGTFYMGEDHSTEGLTLVRVPVITGYENLMNHIVKFHQGHQL